jgi:hypothetical protein
MKTFWNDSEGFSIKDLYGIVFCLLFTGVTLYSLIANDPPHIATALGLLQIMSPIILTILGGYAISEGAKGVMNAYSNRNQDITTTSFVPYSSTTSVPPSTTTPAITTSTTEESDGSI